MEHIGLALQLMIVGMATVFIILLIVIQLGKWLIQLVNRFAPPEKTAPRSATQSVTAQATIDDQTKAIIEAAVSKLTEGKERKRKIERL